MHLRDYSIGGPDADRAIVEGLVTEDWYKTPIDRSVMKVLMQRTDHPALRDTVVLFGLMLVFSAVGIALWPSWWSVPFWLGYGVLYGSAMDSRWHECGHGTAFKTRWLSKAVYQIARFCMMRDPSCWKFSHARHHSDTVIVGRDPEIVIMRPVVVAKMMAGLIGVLDVKDAFVRMGWHAGGRILPDEAQYLDPVFFANVVRTARVWLAIYCVTVAAALVFRSWIPMLLIGLPRVYGCWHMVICGWLQHGGLSDNVTDHRLNPRTVYMNRASRFIYWNMNYHVEHHMFRLVPYFQLPKLHAALAHDLPTPNPSIVAAYAEMLPALLRQRTDPDFHLLRPLPATATPYRVAPSGRPAPQN